MKKSYPSSLKTLGLVLGLLLGLSLGTSAQSLIHVELWKNAAGTGGSVNNYPVWIKLGAPLNYTMSGTTDNTGRYMDSIPNITVPTSATFITYSCTGATIVSQIILSPNNNWYGDTLVVACSTPKPVLHTFANATQSTINPLLFSFLGGYSDSAMPSGRSYTYSWNFGDGQSATGSLNTTHTYANAGTYVACLTVTVSDTLHNLTLFSKTNCVTVVAGSASNCQADFRFSTTGSGAFGFMDSSMVGTTPVGGSVSYGWDFGDGFGASTQSATHTYQTPGTYNVCHWLVVRNAQNNVVCVDTICKTMNYAGNPPAGTCSASFRYRVDGGNGLQFLGGAGSNGFPQVSRYLFAWDFGDGTSDTSQYPAHVYPNSGYYQTCLTTYTIGNIGDTLCSQTYCDSVEVGFPLSNGGSGCSSFFVPQVDPQDPLRYTFIDSSIAAGVGPSISNFKNWIVNENGKKSSYNSFSTPQPAPQFNHIYKFKAPGTYYVCLYAQVKDSVRGGSFVCASKYCDSIVVGAQPSPFCNAQYKVDTANSYLGNVFIWNTSTPSTNSSIHANSYHWDFGDGNSSNQPFPVHTYPNPGVYGVCLTITSVDSANNFCTDTYCDTLGVDSLGNLIYKTTGGFTLNVLDPGAIGLEERIVDEFAVYPNPANDVVSVAWNRAVNGEMKWQITDLKGALLMRGAEDASNKKEMQLDVSRLKAGVYILSASHKNNPVAHYKLRIN